MEMLLSFSGMLGAACCVGMYAAVILGKISADKPVFFAVNGLGALLILAGAAHDFDLGDAGTIGQELIWAIISLVGGARAWAQAGGFDKLYAWREQVALSVFTGLYR